MSKELVINTDGQTTRIAIVEKGELAELFIETEEHERTIGNLFVGRVRRVMPSIQAAFVDIGQKQDAFLHFSDLGESLPDWLEYIQSDKPDIARFASGSQGHKKGGKRRRPTNVRPRKRLEDGAEDPEAELADEQSGGKDRQGRVVRNKGRHRKARQKPGRGRRGGRGRNRQNNGGDGAPPESFLKRDHPILVKVSKEPIAQKGSRVTTDISLAGRFLVLVPMANYVAVSKKIGSFKERRRLRALAKMLLPDGFGVIVRTVAEGQNAKALDTDLRLLREKWTDIEKKLAQKPKPPAPVYVDVNMVSSIMRDLFSEDFDRILIDEQRMYRNIKSYVQAIAPDMASKVKFHDKNTPVFRAVKIDNAVNEAFESRVNLPSGGYLYIEQTEAMHVIDVNSGRAGKGLSQEDNSLKVNLEAARVIARQIRLRDLGGILVIDFIDMRSERSRRKVHDQMRREFRKDRAVTKVLPMSDFGLMQITRQRLRPSITTTFSDLHEEATADAEEETTQVATPSAARERERPRHVEPAEVVGRIEDWLEAFGTARWKGAIRLKVHPFTAAYLSRGIVPLSVRTFFRHRVRLVLEEAPGMDPARFRFYDETNGKEIRRPPRRGRKKKSDRLSKRHKPDGQKQRKDSDDSVSQESGADHAAPSSRQADTSSKRDTSQDGGSGGEQSGRDARGGRGGRRQTSERGGRSSRSDQPQSSPADSASEQDSAPETKEKPSRRRPSSRTQASRGEKDSTGSRGRSRKSEDSPREEAQETGREEASQPKTKATAASSKPAGKVTEKKSRAESEPNKDSPESSRSKEPNAPRETQEPNESGPKSSTPQPFKLRYSSSHVSESSET